jgi:hypothetical protein
VLVPDSGPKPRPAFISLLGLSFFGRDVHKHGFSVPLPTPEEFGPGGQDEKSGNSRMCERGVPLHPGERGGRLTSSVDIMQPQQNYLKFVTLGRI